MNKKALAPSIMVTVIAMAIVFLVVFRFYSVIISIMKGIGEDYFFCLIKKVISAYTKVPIIGIETVWGAFCPPAIYTIALASQDPKIISIGRSLPDRQIEDINKWYNGNYEDENKALKSNGYVNAKFLLKYNLDKSIADGMRRCWGRNGQGRLPLGKEWQNGFKMLSPDIIYYCDLCGVIKFDPDLVQTSSSLALGGRLSIDEFTQKNPVSKGSSQSYWEYLKDDSFTSDFFRGWEYVISNNDYGIVYIRANPNQMKKLLSSIKMALNLQPDEPYDDILLVPISEYQKLCIKKA